MKVLKSLEGAESDHSSPNCWFFYRRENPLPNC